MENTTFKEELKQRIDLEDDPVILKAIKDLLFPEENDPIYKEKLISRALKADEDIKAGRVYTSEEFFKKSQEYFKNK
jgi:hypothetical protein